MKRTVVAALLACALCAGTFAQSGQSMYVSARGSDANDGLSEDRPLKTFERALYYAIYYGIKQVVVIGTLNFENSDDYKRDYFWVFFIGSDGAMDQELLVTGKPGATGAERAVLSGRGAENDVTVIITANANIRFEHIEITNTQGEGVKSPLFIPDGGRVTLGPGTVVQGNNAETNGIRIGEGNCIIDGGEIRNTSVGIVINEKGVVTMRDGIIRNHITGVYSRKGGQFTMSGGTITANLSGVVVESGGRYDQSGGTITSNDFGVAVKSGGRYDQTGGTVTGNSKSNISRLPGSLGSDLSSSGSSR